MLNKSQIDSHIDLLPVITRKSELNDKNSHAERIKKHY